MNNRKELALKYQLPETFMYVHGLSNNTETVNEIFIMNKLIKTEEELEKISTNAKEVADIGVVNIENNKISFFQPNDFKVFHKDEYEQRFFKCENGEYKIKGF